MAQECVLTPEFRLSFPSLFTPTADMEGRVKFRMDMLFPKDIVKTNPKEIGEMKKLYDGGIKPEWIAGKMKYRKFTEAFIDGDTKGKDETKGRFILRATSGPDYPPRLLTASRQTASAADIYAGCFCRAILTRFAYEATNEKGVIINRGVSFNIHTVQKVRDGDKFSKALSDEEADALLAAHVIDGAESDDLASLLGD